jgi:uncharacterized protein
MRIEYDPIKREVTLESRGLDMADAILIFEGRTLTRQDIRNDYGEKRFITVGFLADRMVILVWTRRGTARRIISLRKANDREERDFTARMG